MKAKNITHITPLTKCAVVMLFIMVTVFTFSCNKYLDVKQNSATALISTASDCQLLLNFYPRINVDYPSDGEAAADNYFLSDTGYRTLSSEDAKVYTWAPTAQRSTSNQQWLYPYQTVYSANIVLEALNRIGLGGADQATVNDIKGQALFLRAYSFFQIAQLYCKQYIAASATQDPGIPLHLSSDVNEKSVRGTVKQTYDQITGDLQTAVGLLATTSSVSSRPNKASAYALLARVYLSMSDYTDAGKAANSCLQISNNLLDYNSLDATSATPFIRFNKEVIFQTTMSPGAATYVGNSVVYFDNTLSQQIAEVDTTLYAEYDNNDLRKAIFFKANTGINAGSVMFTGSYDPTPYSAAYFDGIATDEIYLTRAECYARAGNPTSAMADLNTLLRTRWTAGTYTDMTASSADDALVKVLTERRKELLYRGIRWSDLRRLNMETRFQVTLKRIVAGQTYTLPPNDLRYVQLIPVDVIANSTMAQNPR